MILVRHGAKRQVMRNIVFFHISSAIAGELIAILASLISLLFLFQHRLLKLKKITILLARLPSLEKLEVCLSRLLRTGFVLLSLSLASGFFILYELWPKAPDNYKILWAISVWIWYLIVFILKICYKKRLFTAQMSLLGCILLSTALFGYIFD